MLSDLLPTTAVSRKEPKKATIFPLRGRIECQHGLPGVPTIGTAGKEFARRGGVGEINHSGPGTTAGRVTDRSPLERRQRLGNVIHRQRFLLGLLGDAVDLFESRHAPNDFEHSIGVER